ncbi:MAG TPA: type II toxin-antitoxin system RelE/ParE family toxin [Candidatus Kapabacteria bacterium]|nr:type II toxin-antitoxin system RelE/ParE family toxin [Candidatus Kapabacteria bacterium]
MRGGTCGSCGAAVCLLTPSVNRVRDVQIAFGDRRLRKVANDVKELTREYGPARARKLIRRLQELRSAECLEDLRNLPGPRCHELRKNRTGQLSIDLDHPYRLIFEPSHDPVPRKADGGIDWRLITAITILEITDTHE